MDDATANELLGQIKQARTELPPAPGWLSHIPGAGTVSSWFSGSRPSPEAAAFKAKLHQNLTHDAVKDLLRLSALGLGAGAAIRGAVGLEDLLGGRNQARAPRVVEMPVPYPAEEEKAAFASMDNPDATSKAGLPWYTAGMLLGVPLSVYGGWKGVDSFLSSQKAKETEDDLERAKQDYQDALLSSYKKATDEALDQAFDSHEKSAGAVETTQWLLSQPGKLFPNASGAAKGLAAAYTLTTLPLGYQLVNQVMKSRSQETLLRKAMEERARRQAMSQPPELYAVPTPIEEEV